MLKLRDNLSCSVVGDMVDLRNSNFLKVRFESEAEQWASSFMGMQTQNDQNRLKMIDLSNTAIRDEHLPALYKFDKVEMINLSGTWVSKAAVAELQQALPKAIIYFDAAEDQAVQ